jgi:drug/metabolite transporter (DMT)-like permease
MDILAVATDSPPILERLQIVLALPAHRITFARRFNMPDTRTLALSSGCLAALGWGLTGTFIKLLPQFSTFEILAIRLAVSFAMLLPILLLRRSLYCQLKILICQPIIILLSSLMVFYYLFAVRAFQLAPVSDVVLVVGLSPLLGVVGKVAARQALKSLETIGAVTAFSGLVLFVLPKVQVQTSDVSIYFTGLGFALLSAVVSLSYASLFKQCAKNQPLLNPVLVGFITFTIGSSVMLPLIVVSSPQSFISGFNIDVIIISLGLSVLSTVIPTLCYSYAAKHLSPVLTTALNLMTPIFAAAIAALLLNEYLSLVSLIGAGLILIGILILSISSPSISTPRKLLK